MGSLDDFADEIKKSDEKERTTEGLEQLRTIQFVRDFMVRFDEPISSLLIEISRSFVRSGRFNDKFKLRTTLDAAYPDQLIAYGRCFWELEYPSLSNMDGDSWLDHSDRRAEKYSSIFQVHIFAPASLSSASGYVQVTGALKSQLHDFSIPWLRNHLEAQAIRVIREAKRL